MSQCRCCCCCWPPQLYWSVMLPLTLHNRYAIKKRIQIHFRKEYRAKIWNAQTTCRRIDVVHASLLQFIAISVLLLCSALASTSFSVGRFFFIPFFCSTLSSYGKIDHLERTVWLLLWVALFLSRSDLNYFLRFFFFFVCPICAKIRKILQKANQNSPFMANNVRHIRWNEYVRFELTVCVFYLQLELN